MKTKNSKNSNLNGNFDKTIRYTGDPMDMGGYDFAEMGLETYDDMYPNIGDALKDIISMSYGKVGDIVIREDLTSPEGLPQTDILKITVVGDDKAPHDAKIKFFGKILEVKEGETAIIIKQKMLDILTDFVDNNNFLTSAELNSDNDIELTYKDNRNHNTKDMIPFPHFLGIEVVTLTKNTIGFGKWEMIGSKTEKFDGNEVPVTLNYYKRIG